jgi:hypothetical protein
MKKADIENRIKTATDDAKSLIAKQPLHSFAAGIVIGILLAEFSRVLIPLLIVFIVVVAAFWFFADEDSAAGASS